MGIRHEGYRNQDEVVSQAGDRLMPEKYHIQAEPADPRFEPVFKLSSIEKDGCLGCLECAKRKCIYDVYEKRRFLSGQLRDSAGSFCKSCMRCVQECKNQILIKLLNPEWAEIGNTHWTPAIITSLWQQAQTGMIPVSGAGYDGPFMGPGFDDMWTDMSEIVRPTRDGIHGREYISTSIDIGRKLSRLNFAGNKSVDVLPPLISIPLPILFDAAEQAQSWPNVTQAIRQAAEQLKILSLCDHGSDMGPHVVPRFRLDDTIELPGSHRMMELLLDMDNAAALEKAVTLTREISGKRPDLVIGVGLPISENAAASAIQLSQKGIGVIRLYANRNGRAPKDGKGRFVKDIVRDVHRGLVAESLRDSVTLLAGGGIAMAEHVAKLIACGADGIVVDDALLVALECRICLRCLNGQPCELKINDIDSQWGTKRIINLIASWHSQLIEVMGAMGLREVRRLRGETGRVMFFKDLEEECFAPMFGKRTGPPA
jgi:ferredoxin